MWPPRVTVALFLNFAGGRLVSVSRVKGRRVRRAPPTTSPVQQKCMTLQTLPMYTTFSKVRLLLTTAFNHAFLLKLGKNASVDVMATTQSSEMPILKEKVTHKLEKLAQCHGEHVLTHTNTARSRYITRSYAKVRAFFNSRKRSPRQQSLKVGKSGIGSSAHITFPWRVAGYLACPGETRRPSRAQFFEEGRMGH